MKDLILGSNLLFARGGTVIDGITVGRDAKPDATPASNYTRLASVEQFEAQNSKTMVKRRAPNPGKFGARKVIMVSQDLTLNFSMQEWDQLAFAELLFGGKPPVDGVFVPNDQGDPVEGWLKIQAYDQNNVQTLVMDVYVSLSIASYQFKEGLDPYTLVAEVLDSELNSALVTNL